MEATQPTSKKARLEGSNSHLDGNGKVDSQHIDNNYCNTNTIANTTLNNSNTTGSSIRTGNILENRKKRGSSTDCGSRSRFREQQSQSKVICSSSTTEFEKCIR